MHQGVEGGVVEDRRCSAVWVIGVLRSPWNNKGAELSGRGRARNENRGLLPGQAARGMGIQACYPQREKSFRKAFRADP